jgi:soluble lytic murein transglycosylase-like protein
VKLAGEVKPIRSRAGAVGVMQVNTHVWRGLYDPRFLSLDPAYNARAGSQILLHYFMGLARNPGEVKSHGDLNLLVRASYAAYNGGPSQLRRYRTGKIPKRHKAIDENLFDKYQKVKSGKELEVARCF